VVHVDDEAMRAGDAAEQALELGMVERAGAAGAANRVVVGSRRRFVICVVADLHRDDQAQLARKSGVR
jgi:hypothetical protein